MNGYTERRRNLVKKYYINKKTNDVVMNLAPNSNLASRTRRTAAGMIDFSVSVGKVSFSL